MIVGEAGIGKTALAESLAAEAAEDGGTVLRTRCYDTERSLFIQPIVEAIAPVVARTPAGALRQLLGEHAEAAASLLPEVAAILGPPPSGRGSMEVERRRAFEAAEPSCAAWPTVSPSWSWWTTCSTPGSHGRAHAFPGRQLAGARLLMLATVRAENDAQIGAALAPVASRVEVGPSARTRCPARPRGRAG